MREYIAELIGTFTLILIGTAVAVLQQPGLLSEGGWDPPACSGSRSRSGSP